VTAGRSSSGDLNLDANRGRAERALEALPDAASLMREPAVPSRDLNEADLEEQLQAYLDRAIAPKQTGFPPIDALSARLNEFPPPPIQHAEVSKNPEKGAAMGHASAASEPRIGSDLAWFEERFSELKHLLEGDRRVEKGEIVSINAKLAEIIGRVDRLSSAIPGEKAMAAVETQLVALNRSIEASRNQGFSDADRIARAAKEILAATERAEEVRAGFETAARHTVKELGQTVRVAATHAAVVTAERFATAMQHSAQEGGLARVEQQLRDLNAHSRESSERTTAALERVHETLRVFLEKGSPQERVNAAAAPKKRPAIHVPITADAPAYSHPDALFGIEPATKPQLDTITLRTPPPHDTSLLDALREATERHAARSSSSAKPGAEKKRQPTHTPIVGALFREDEKALPLFGLGVVAVVLLIASAALYYLQTRTQLPPFHLTVLPDLQNTRVSPSSVPAAPARQGAAEEGPEKTLNAVPKQAPGLFTAAEQGRSTTPPKPEPREDLQMLTSAASRGDREAQFRIGALFLNESGAQVDPTSAARWLGRAAEQGHTESQFVLASLYERGAGVPKDEARALALYRKAASAGHIRAMHNLGVLLSAHDAPESYAEAARWFMTAATAGLADSQFNLALLYERGLGLQQDGRKAYFWYQVASLAGDKEAARQAERLRRQLPDAVSQAAAEQAGSWRPTVEQQPRLAGGAERG
jgi:localization factor PodJL